MRRFKIPERFSKKYFNPYLMKRFVKFLGPVQNYFGAETIYYLNLRIFIKPEGFKFRIVNKHYQEYDYIVENYTKGLLRTYSDLILTSVYNYLVFRTTM
jgi:hypothetical protein